MRRWSSRLVWSAHDQRWTLGLACALLTACSFTRFKPVERAIALDEAFHLLTSLVRPTKEEVPLDDRTAHCYQLPLSFAVTRAAPEFESEDESTSKSSEDESMAKLRPLPVRQEVGADDKQNQKVMGSVLLPKETENACSQAVERVSQLPRALQRLPKISVELAKLEAFERERQAVIQTLEVERLQLEVARLQAVQLQAAQPQTGTAPSGVETEGAPTPPTATAPSTTAPSTTAPPTDATTTSGSSDGAPTVASTASTNEPLPATPATSAAAELELARVHTELAQLRAQSDTTKVMRAQFERMRELEVTRTRGELTYDPASNTADGVLVLVTSEELDAGEQVWLDIAHEKSNDAGTRFDLRVTNDMDWFGLPVGASLVVVFLVLTAG